MGKIARMDPKLPSKGWDVPWPTPSTRISKSRFFKVDCVAFKTTCPEDDSGEAFAELIRAKTLKVCTMYTPKKCEPTVSPLTN